MLVCGVLLLCCLVCPVPALVYFRRKEHQGLVGYGRGDLHPSAYRNGSNIASDKDVDADNVMVIAPNNLPAGYVGEEIFFEMPGTTGDLVCRVDSIVDHVEPYSRSYSGVIGPKGASMGSFMLSCSDKTNLRPLICVGNLRLDHPSTFQYELRPIKDGTAHIITKVSVLRYVDKIDSVVHPHHESAPGIDNELHFRSHNHDRSAERTLRKPLSEQTSDASADIMDIMVVYTEYSVLGLGSDDAVKLFVNHAFDEANQILERSLVDMRIRAIYVEKMQNTAYVDPDDLATSLYEATSYNSAYSEFDFEQNMRYTLGADALVVITRPSNPNYCGIAWLNSPDPSPYYMVSVVDLVCMVGYYAFIHEIGHNLGAAHDKSISGPNEGAYSYSHGWCWDVEGAESCDNTCRRSLMSYSSCRSSKHSCNNCNPYPYFSNPDVSESGSATGATGSNNAKTLNKMKSYATDILDSSQAGGLIFSVNPNHIPINVSCFDVRISGWRIGSGSDIVRVALAGISFNNILEQGQDYVVVRCNSSIALPTTGDVIVSRNGGSGTTIMSDAFTFDDTRDTYVVFEDFDGSMSPFQTSGDGAFYYIDSSCPTGPGDVCESYGPSSGSGIFVMVRPDNVASGGRTASVTSKFSSFPSCIDLVRSISVDYYAYSVYPQCYSTGFLQIQVKYSQTGEWVTVATAVDKQTSNTESWFTLKTNELFDQAAVYGVQILANSYSDTLYCPSWNPVAIDNVNVSYSSDCSIGCTLGNGGENEDNSDSSIVYIAVGSAILATIFVCGYFLIGIFYLRRCL